MTLRKQIALAFASGIVVVLMLAATSGNIQWSQIRSDNRHGTGSKGQAFTGSSTTGNCAQFDASGNITDAGAACGGGGSGSLIFLETHTASTSASLDFTTWLSGSYDTYAINIVQLIPTSSSNQIFLRFSTNGGSSYDSGGNYTSFGTVIGSFGGPVLGGSDSSTGIELTGRNTNDIGNAGPGLSGWYYLYNPGGGTNKPALRGQANYTNGGGTFNFSDASGAYNLTTAVTDLQIIAGTSTLASGIVRIYGVAH